MLKRTYRTGKSCEWTGVAVKPWETEFLKRSLIDTSVEMIISSEKGGNLDNISCYSMSIHARIRCTEESHLRRPESQNYLNELKLCLHLGKRGTPSYSSPIHERQRRVAFLSTSTSSWNLIPYTSIVVAIIIPMI